jgi:uncharacterized SAM-binding protein YcdF (DUF218 family)
MLSFDHHPSRNTASRRSVSLRGDTGIGDPQMGTSAFRTPSRRVFGLLTRKERWGVSRAGWLFIIPSAFIIVGIVGAYLYPFLAVTDRVETNILVVEGWVHPYAIHAAVEEFRTGSYQRIFTTGGPVVGRGGYVNDFQTAASVGADLLRKEGIPGEALQKVPTRVMGRDRTYSSAAALKNWLLEHNLRVRSLNIVTEGAHARRSRLLFEEALGRDVNVGVISVPSPDFDASRWWYYSEGVEDVVEEGLGYLYAKFLYYPGKSEPAPQKNAIRNGSPAAGPALSD